MRVLADRRAPLFLAVLWVNVVFRLGDQGKTDGERDALTVIQCGEKVDAFDSPVLGMIVVPADNIVFIREGLFGDAVVKNDGVLRTLDLAHMRLGDLPQVGGGSGLARQEACNFVVADFPVQQGSKPGGSCLNINFTQSLHKPYPLFTHKPYSVCYSVKQERQNSQMDAMPEPGMISIMFLA